jgi:hypothetical protein
MDGLDDRLPSTLPVHFGCNLFGIGVPRRTDALRVEGVYGFCVHGVFAFQCTSFNFICTGHVSVSTRNILKMDVAEITNLLQNTSLREELPDSYSGRLTEEFTTIVAFQNLACVSLACNHQGMATVVHAKIRKFIHLVNNFYFVMYNEKAPRITDEDLELARVHAIQEIPVESYHDAFQVDEEELRRTFRATSNICHETLNHFDFILGEFREQFRTTQKSQCKRATKYFTKLKVLIKSVTDELDQQTETAHMYVNKDTVTHSDMTSNERKLHGRKSKGRSRR